MNSFGSACNNFRLACIRVRWRRPCAPRSWKKNIREAREREKMVRFTRRSYASSGDKCPKSGRFPHVAHEQANFADATSHEPFGDAHVVLLVLLHHRSDKLTVSLPGVALGAAVRGRQLRIPVSHLPPQHPGLGRRFSGDQHGEFSSSPLWWSATQRWRRTGMRTLA